MRQYEYEICQYEYAVYYASSETKSHRIFYYRSVCHFCNSLPVRVFQHYSPQSSSPAHSFPWGSQLGVAPDPAGAGAGGEKGEAVGAPLPAAPRRHRRTRVTDRLQPRE